MLEMSWITAILQLYSQVTDLFGSVIVKRLSIRPFDSQVTDLFGNVIVKRLNISLFDLLARCHHITY